MAIPPEGYQNHIKPSASLGFIMILIPLGWNGHIFNGSLWKSLILILISPIEEVQSGISHTGPDPLSQCVWWMLGEGTALYSRQFTHSGPCILLWNTNVLWQKIKVQQFKGISYTTGFVVKHRCPRRQQSKNLAKSLVLLWPAPPCDRFWPVPPQRNHLINLQSKFGYFMSVQT